MLSLPPLSSPILRHILGFLSVKEQTLLKRVNQAWKRAISPTYLPQDLVGICVSFLNLKDMSETVLVSKLWAQVSLLGARQLADSINVFYNSLYQKIFPVPPVEMVQYSFRMQRALILDLNNCKNLSEIKSSIFKFKDEMKWEVLKLTMEQLIFLKESTEIKIPYGFENFLEELIKEKTDLKLNAERIRRNIAPYLKILESL